MYMLTSQLKGIQLQLSSVHGNAAVMEALGKATEALHAVGESMSIKDIMNMIKDYTKESEKLGMKQELMEEAMDVGLDGGEVGADGEQIYGQICDEIGVEYQNEGAMPGGALSSGVGAGTQNVNAGGL